MPFLLFADVFYGRCSILEIADKPPIRVCVEERYFAKHIHTLISYPYPPQNECNTKLRMCWIVMNNIMNTNATMVLGIHGMPNPISTHISPANRKMIILLTGPSLNQNLPTGDNLRARFSASTERMLFNETPAIRIWKICHMSVSPFPIRLSPSKYSIHRLIATTDTSSMIPIRHLRYACGYTFSGASSSGFIFITVTGDFGNHLSGISFNGHMNQISWLETPITIESYVSSVLS